MFPLRRRDMSRHTDFGSLWEVANDIASRETP
jgi:hypothetical protein